MAVRARIDVFDRDILVAFAADLSPEARSATLAEVAREGIAEAVEINRRASGGAEPTYTQTVDGRLGAALESVRPDGVIEVEFLAALRLEAVEWIRAALAAAAPVRSGRFRDSFVLFADGVAVASPDAARDADEWIFVSTVPYARKLEGMGNRPPLSRQAPDGVFHAVAVDGQRRFGNVASVKFASRSIEGGMLSAWASRTKLRSKGHARPDRRRDWLTRQPAIVVTFR